MLTGKETKISDQYHQLKAGGDVAAILGLCKCVVEADDVARAAGEAEVIDHAFVKQHTTGFDDFIQSCRTTSWAEIEQGIWIDRGRAARGGRRVYRRRKGDRRLWHGPYPAYARCAQHRDAREPAAVAR